MITPKVNEYIRNQRLQNVTDSEIVDVLMKSGWKKEDIVIAMQQNNSLIPSSQSDSHAAPLGSFSAHSQFATQQSVLPEFSEKKPWSPQAVIGCSFLFSYGSSYLIIWQNLKRYGEIEEARRFFIKGGLVFLLLTIVNVQLLSLKPDADIGLIFWWLIFTSWYQSINKKLLKPKNMEVKFSASIFGWSILGSLLTIVTTYIFLFTVNVVKYIFFLSPK